MTATEKGCSECEGRGSLNLRGEYFCGCLRKGPEYDAGRGERKEIIYSSLGVCLYKCKNGNGISKEVKDEEEAVTLVLGAGC